MARFNFKALYHAVTIRGRLDFEGGIYREQHARAYTASIMSLFVCTYNACAQVYRHRPRTMWRDFESGGISRCGEILRKYDISSTFGTYSQSQTHTHTHTYTHTYTYTHTHTHTASSQALQAFQCYTIVTCRQAERASVCNIEKLGGPGDKATNTRVQWVR